MHTLYLLSVWVHILAATVWIGGMLFLVLVVVPWLRKGARPDAAVFLRETGERFRNVGWICFVVLLITGTFNLWVRGTTVVVKLSAFFLVLMVSSIHDFVIGPRATRAIAADAGSTEAQVQRRRASVLGRVNVLLALILVAAGVMLVRGVPW